MALQQEKIEKSDFHLIGVVCIQIASKYEEVATITMKQLKNYICQKKFSKKEIIAMEMKVLKTLKFRVSFQTLKDHIDSFINSLK